MFPRAAAAGEKIPHAIAARFINASAAEARIAAPGRTLHGMALRGREWPVFMNSAIFRPARGATPAAFLLRLSAIMPMLRPRWTCFVATALALSAAACGDSTAPAPLHGPGEAPGPAAQRLLCSVDVATRVISCAPQASAGGARANRTLGSGTDIQVTSGNVAVTADTFAFDLAVTNHFPYPIGTQDGVNPDPDGIRVFFVDGIHTTGGTGQVTVANADGATAFTAANQAYFAYPGILSPGAATAPRRWKLQFDPGVQTFSFGLYVNVPVPPGGGGVYFTVQQPAADAVVGDSAVVQVKIDSAAASISTVTASAAGRSVTLQVVSPGVLRGKLNLLGIAAGPQQLRVRVVTVHADSAVKLVAITKDSPPRLTVTAPRAWWVAGANLRLDADCIDDDPAGCTSLQVVAAAPLLYDTLAMGTTSVHQDASVSAFDGKMPEIRFLGTDSRGRSVQVTVEVYVETTPALVRIDSAGSVAMDVDSSRLLFQDDAGSVWAHDQVAGTRTLLGGGGTPPGAAGNRSYGWLNPLGAIYAVGQGSDRVYDWRGGTPVDLGGAISGTLAASGNWAVWHNGAALIRRDLAAGTNLTVSTAAGNNGLDVAANGDVVFWTSSGYDVYRYRAGVVTLVSADSSAAHWNVYPLTDGTNVVWFKSDQAGKLTLQPGRVTLWDGATETVFPSLFTNPDPRRKYAVSGGWVAYLATDGGGFNQVRTRAPDGMDRQATSGGSSSEIRAVGSDGTLVYANGASLYVVRAPYTGTRTRLGNGTMRARFDGGGRLLLFLGNTAFTASY
ncbi:hypothetical protein SAMN05216486_1222 [bacterium JGI 053]|nr:hypothetical protein SAMN05216486_1222 [bacterium JGI 053]